MVREYLIPILATICFLASLAVVALLTLDGTGVPGEVSATLQVSLGALLTSGATTAQRTRL